ncbi:hypothetical protein [Sulfitobacter sp. MF3-043]|uniref:hypothetical protein n=1 Tax=Sulfitobacter sediminivivens TaxID=3252902 RepID=UPI0036D81D59
MFLRCITKSVHAYLDYPVALGLIAMPFLFGLGETAPLVFWLSVAAGVAASVLNVLTDHHPGIVQVLPYSLHFTVDGLVRLTFVAAPIVMGFAGVKFGYYMVLGLPVPAVVGLHQSEDRTAIAP